MCDECFWYSMGVASGVLSKLQYVSQSTYFPLLSLQAKTEFSIHHSVNKASLGLALGWLPLGPQLLLKFSLLITSFLLLTR